MTALQIYSLVGFVLAIGRTWSWGRSRRSPDLLVLALLDCIVWPVSVLLATGCFAAVVWIAAAEIWHRRLRR